MQTVLIVIHLLIVLALVGVVLVQRSEGGGLGIGGGGGNMMATRGSGNALTRITGILAAAFFLTSLSLGVLARYEGGSNDILDRIPTELQGTGDGILDQLGGAPSSEAPVADTPAESSPESGVPSGDGAAAPSSAAPQADAPASAAPTGEERPASGSATDGVPTGQ